MNLNKSQNRHKSRIAVIVGSTRRDSLNRKLARALAALGAGAFDVGFAEIGDLPLYNQDLEAELPAAVIRFKAELAAADGVLIVTPEHSRAIPAALKNAIDWAARPWGKSSWPGKIAAITGTSPGSIGTAIAQQQLRQILGSLGVIVMGGEAYITYKPDLIAADHSIGEESTRKFLADFIAQFAALVARLSPAKAAA